MQEERRLDYRSVLPGTELVYRMAPARPAERRYLLGVAKNLSLGGLFIAARHPFPAGTLVCLDLYPGSAGDMAPFSARAVVRWRRLWQEPRGMGLQFLDFANLGKRSMASLLDGVLVREPAAWRPGAELVLAEARIAVA
jgi:hypothetical protein